MIHPTEPPDSNRYRMYVQNDAKKLFELNLIQKYISFARAKDFERHASNRIIAQGISTTHVEG